MKRMLNDEQIFELQELLEQVSISSGVVNFNKIHTEELTISDNGKWNGSGIFIDDLTMIKDNGETPAPLLPLSVANAGKVLAVGEDGESVDAVEVSGGTQLYVHSIIFNNNENLWLDIVNNSAELEFGISIPDNLETIRDAYLTGITTTCGDTNNTYKVLEITLNNDELTIKGLINGSIMADDFDALQITSISCTSTPL